LIGVLIAGIKPQLASRWGYMDGTSVAQLRFTALVLYLPVLFNRLVKMAQVGVPPFLILLLSLIDLVGADCYSHDGTNSALSRAALA
jgi:hypothetical protein